LKLFIKCAEYTLSNYVEEINDKGKKKKKELPKEDVKFLIKNVKEFPYGLQQTKMNLYNNPILTDIEKDVQWMNILKTLISDSTASNNLLIEKMMVHFMQERIDVLFNEVLPRCDKNTLLLAHHTEYVNYLTDKIKEKFSDTHIIVKITGSISSKKREEIKQTLKENNNCILIASYGTMSTGITLSNLCYGILFESFKSDVVNMQSIGRGLGLSDLKDKYRLFDFVDCFDQEITNKIFLQGLARIKIYNKDFNKHKYYIKNIDINDGIDEDFNSEFYNIINEEKENKKLDKKKAKKKENKENDLFSGIYF
jgi:superfamily II DNA or RNA helicase